MSFCVNCGVKLADYHTNCPLCGTKVINPNETQKEIRRDYPQYRKHLNRKQKNQMRQYLTGWILSMVIALFIAAAVIVDLVISRQITWSVIPVLSLIFLWYTIARPFFGTHNTFHGLFATSSIAIAVYLAILDFILSGRLGWSLIASSSVLFVWAFIN